MIPRCDCYYFCSYFINNILWVWSASETIPSKGRMILKKNFQLFNFITVNLLQKKVPKNYCCDSENLSQFQSSQFNGLPICSFGLEKKTLHDYTYWFSPTIFLVYCYNFIQITHHYAKFKGNQNRAIKLSVCT